MVTYNYNNREEEAVIKFANQHQKGILVKKALQSGALTNDVVRMQENINFILKQPAVASIILGTLNLSHLKQNAQLFS